MKSYLPRIAIVLPLTLGGFTASAATVVYTELFPNTTGTSGGSNLSFSTAGWGAYLGATATDNSGLTSAAVISNIAGFDGAGGYGAKTSTGSVGLFFTTEFTAIDRAATEIDAISFAINNGNAGDLLRIAIRLDVANTPGVTTDDLWFATSATYTHSGGTGNNPPTTSSFLLNGAVRTLDFDTAASTWRSLTFVPNAQLELGSVLAAPLPDGALTGAGIYHDANSATTRFDNFTIEVVPEPGCGALLLLGSAALAGLRRPRKLAAH